MKPDGSSLYLAGCPRTATDNVPPVPGLRTGAHLRVFGSAAKEREPDEIGVVLNLANVVRVSKTDGASTGQYL
jgi:hypothetical protein